MNQEQVTTENTEEKAAEVTASSEMTGQTQEAEQGATGAGHGQRRGRERQRLHLLLAFGTRTSHRPLSERNPSGQPHGKGTLPEAQRSDARTAGAVEEVERRGSLRGRNSGRKSFGMDTETERRNQRTGRSQLCRTTGKEHEVRAC